MDYQENVVELIGEVCIDLFYFILLRGGCLVMKITFIWYRGLEKKKNPVSDLFQHSGLA